MAGLGGLHNMPIEMRPAVAAEAGHVFVRADLGQVEPRVLAAAFGDKVLARATLDDDMYAQVGVADANDAGAKAVLRSRRS
jgi:DNA polymerase-1